MNERYVLISPDNTTRVFHIKECAEMFQVMYKGHIVVIYMEE